MGFYDELKQTSQQNYAPPYQIRPFPETGVDDKVQWLAYETMTKIKKNLSELVELKAFSDGAYCSEIEQTVVINGNESHIEHEPFRTPNIYFPSWAAAETYYTLIDRSLTAERLYHKWYINYSYEGKKDSFTFGLYLNKLHSLLKKRWNVNEHCKRLDPKQESNYKNKHRDVFGHPHIIRLDVILPCDSKGVIR